MTEPTRTIATQAPGDGPRPYAALYLPAPALGSCVFAGIGRDTRGADLDDAGRFNHFPASPLIALSVVMQGQLAIVPPGQNAQACEAAPQVTIIGAQSGPITSWSPGAVTVLTIGMYPDAFEALTGADPAGYVDQISAKIPPALAPVVKAIQNSPDPAQGWTAAHKVLAQIWQGESAAPARLADWSRGLIVRAALSGPGQSLRSAQRRIKRMVGLPGQSLAHFARIEALHAQVTAAPHDSLAAIAHDAGFADQSHMGRALIRTTGFSPKALNDRIAHDPAFWCYRLLGERF